jgi:hypothetical protein
MPFPTVQISTSNLDSSTDDPSLARADLLDAVEKLNTIISEGGSAQGVALLDSGGKLASGQIPTSISSSGTQILSPSTGIVNIQDRLRLTAFTNEQIVALSAPTLGDIVIASNIGVDQGPGVAFYSGTAWRAIGFGNIALSGNVQFTTIT